MNEKFNSWGGFLNSYFGNKPKKKEEQKSINTHYGSFEDVYFAKARQKVDEENAELQPHLEEEEKYIKFVEEHMIDEPEQIIETEVDAYEAAIADNSQSVELQETQETHLDEGVVMKPIDQPEFTQEELEAFKTLNADKFIHETNDEQPIETKVKKVKVSKPKTPKKPSKPKTKKQ